MAQQGERLHTYGGGKAKMAIYATDNPQEFIMKTDTEGKITVTSNISFVGSSCSMEMTFDPKYQKEPQYGLETRDFTVALGFCAWFARTKNAEYALVTYPDRIENVVREITHALQDPDNWSNPASLNCNRVVECTGRDGFYARMVDAVDF
jgi:hypothetical protein